MLHDIGALSLEKRLDILNFDYQDKLRHTEKSYRFLKNFGPFSRVADIIRYHHVPWDNGAGKEYDFEPVPRSSHILNLADRVAVLLNRGADILDQAKEVRGKIERHAGSLFDPQLVEAFNILSRKEYFWFDVTSPRLGDILARQVNLNRGPGPRGTPEHGRPLLQHHRLPEHVYRHPFLRGGGGG